MNMILSFLAGAFVGFVIWHLLLNNPKYKKPYLPKVGEIYRKGGNPFSKTRVEVKDVRKGLDDKIYVGYKVIIGSCESEILLVSVDKFNELFRRL